MYNRETVEAVTSCNDIVSVVSESVQLVPTDTAYVADVCPFCGSPLHTFAVDQKTQTYLCFDCKEGGNVAEFVMKRYNMSFDQAIEALSRRMNVPIEREEEPEQVTKAKEIILEVNRDAANYFFKRLRVSDDAKKYVQKRAMTAETVKAFGLGYAYGRNNDVLSYLKSLGYTEKQIIAAGLAVVSGNEIRDKYRNRLMFPIVRRDGKVIGFGGRAIADDIKPKYLNSPDTVLFDKSSNLYGIDKVVPGTPIVLCEGYMDVIQMVQAEVSAVASLGTALTSQQVKLIQRYTDTVVLSYDNDDAGKIAQEKAKKMFSKTGIKLKNLNLAPVKDPDEFIKTFGKEEFHKRILEATDI